MNIFPVDDDLLDIDILDVFLPFDSFKYSFVPRSATGRSLDTSVQASRPKDSRVEKTQYTPTSNLYCAACKKKFSNEATWNTHLKSAKHIQNEKTVAKNTTVQSGGGQMPKGSGQQKPAVAQISMKLKQAMNLAANNPSRAVGPLWTLAQEFYKLKRPRDSAQILNDLTDLLETLQINSTKIPKEDSLTPAQISGTLYLTRLALSRLYLIYWDDHDSLEHSRKLFLRAIFGKWKIDEQKLNDVAVECTSISISKLLTAAEDLLHTYIEKVLSKPAKVKADANQILPVILGEGELLFSLPRTKTMNACDYSESADPKQVAVAMCAMMMVIHRRTGNIEGELAGYQNLSKIYLKLEAQGSAAEALMEHSYITAQRYDSDQVPSSTWINAMIALIICLEINDVVRAQEIMKRAEWDTTLEDVKALLSLAEAVLEANHFFIRQELYYKVAHVRLLLRSEALPERLLICCLENTQRMTIWNRLEDVTSKFIL